MNSFIDRAFPRASHERRDARARSQPVQTRPVAVALQLQRSIGNAATARLLQRHGGLAGVPGNAQVNAGEYLTHGSHIAAFTVQAGPMAGQPQDAPDPPAWFARGSRFSAHAGSRRGGAATHLHNYEITAAINLLAFDNYADMRQYLTNAGQAPPASNNVAAANMVLALNGGADGYMLEADLVRREPEIILFAPGMGKLTASFSSQLDNEEDVEDASGIVAGDIAGGSKKRALKGYAGQVVHQADVKKLREFQTIADKGGGGRPRGQSM